MIHDRPMHLHGVNIYIAHPLTIPNYKIDNKVQLSDEYRKYINNWLYGFFGGKMVEMVEDDKVIKAPEGLIMNRKTYNKLEVQLDYLNNI